MASAAAKMFVSLLEAKGLNSRFLDDAETVVRVGWKLDNTKISILFYFDEDNRSVHIEGREFLNVPENKIDVMYKACNTCNNQYRWVKFTVDEEDKELVAKDDAVIQLDSCADEVMELMIRMTQIVDDAYPQFMKALWA